MNRKHPTHKRPAPPHFLPPGVMHRARQALRMGIAHALLQICTGQAWNALAVTASVALSALPSELLSAHAWLRTAIPVLLAVIGVGVQSAANHSEVVTKCSA